MTMSTEESGYYIKYDYLDVIKTIDIWINKSLVMLLSLTIALYKETAIKAAMK